MLIWNEAHLRCVLKEFIGWYNHGRVHQGLRGIPDPDPELAGAKPLGGKLVAISVLNGLHHDYRLFTELLQERVAGLRCRRSLAQSTCISGFLEAIGIHSSHCEIETSGPYLESSHTTCSNAALGFRGPRP